jgi:hypothetical protein
MADARLYIVHRGTGLAARFYARSGVARSLGPQDAIAALLEEVSRLTATDDDFFITGNEAEMARATTPGGWQWIALPPEPAVDHAVSEADRLRRENDEIRLENFTLSKRLEHIRKLTEPPR